MIDVDLITNIPMRLYARSAVSLGIDVEILHHQFLIRCSKGATSWNIFGATVPLNDAVAFDLARSKFMTSRLLRDHGLPVPECHLFFSVSDALPFFRSRPYPVVVKPNHGIGGRGITVRPESDQEFTAAFRHAADHDDFVLVEQFISGSNYRVLVLDGRVIAAAERLPPYVVGDGRHTIGELIDLENQARAGDDMRFAIAVDVEAHQCLREQGLGLSTVPPLDQRCFVRRNANLSTGGFTADCTEEIHPDTAAAAVAAARVLGLRLAGVDIIAPSIAESIAASGGAINEVNPDPGLRMHHQPTVGRGREVSAMVLQAILDSRPAAVVR